MLYQYDATGDKCPLPLVKLRVILKKMQSGDSCLMQILDKGSKKDIPALLLRQGYQFSQRELANNVIELAIAKG
ncbi:sulfurtransferase TusA family protein [Endozoicomonas sp. G2_1]|uniref:sulfurtransferase TusA family protein n=1 Tax=Endozoicomonas sp. G2_1 TaxID=2821091 RepID=UPI001ADC5C2F|nr:sulfurtransferase TusA family protein [Endozoicomonas sp. G2_1]MBO9490821.1 sulfurtransferase TusA family protein [Endozoicomonas sp. G2_1]